MGILNHRSKGTQEFSDQKWDYINLADFHARGCGPGFAYFWLWVMLIVSVAVYALDSFIAVNLLIFDKWSSKIQPGIPLNVSKWVFSACILMSFVNLGYEAFRAFRIMKRGNVAECYLDSLAVRWESIRLGSGQGWRRFLVFAELTKSKKGAEYVAVFTYFSLKGWIRILICSAPRQVINAFTFKSVYESKLAVSEDSVEGSIAGFFDKVKSLAEDDYQQALVLGSMAFTFIVFVFSLLFFIAAILCYLTFLCHWIPRSDGGLSGYCERKANEALKRIVTQKVNKALAKGQAKQYQAELKAAQKNGEIRPIERMATLPTLPNLGPAPTPGSLSKPKLAGEDSLPQMPILGRSETTTTLPAYTSRPASPGGIEMGYMNQRRPIPSRTGTMASSTTNRSYSSKAPLLGSAGDMGRERTASPAPALPDINFEYLPPPGPGTPVSQRTFGSQSGIGHIPTYSNSSIRMDMTASPAPIQSHNNPSVDSFYQPMDAGDHFSGLRPAPRRYDTYGADSRGSPAPSSLNQRPTPGPVAYNTYQQDGRPSPAPTSNGYGNQEVPMQSRPPMRSATGPVPPRGPYEPPQRNLTAPMPPRGADSDYFNRPPAPPQGYDRSGTPQGYGRSGTPQGQRGGPYGYDAEAQRDRGYGY